MSKRLLNLPLLFFSAFLAASLPKAQDLQQLELGGYKRLLVLAPHCDDETLDSARLILACLRAGLQVRVALQTNGDGFLFATMEEFRKIYPSHQDFIKMGALRQQESLNALRLLGVEQVSFLSYPDRGTPSLWVEHWSASSPYYSPYSADRRSPYPITYNPESVYAGQDLLHDLLSLLKEYHPDLISLPHPNDVHPDHWGLSAFARLAVALQEREQPGYRPTMIAYLVHRHDFPEPKGLLPAQPLLPPAALFQMDPAAPWLSLELPREDAILKSQALQEYRSQLPLLRGLLESFVRTNELFELEKPANLPQLDSGDLQEPRFWRDAQGQTIEPVQPDPSGDVLIRELLPAADLTDLFAAERTDGCLVVCAVLRGTARAELEYLIQVKAVGPDGVAHLRAQSGRPSAGRLPALSAGERIVAHIPAQAAGKPWIIAVEAEVRERGWGVLDQTAWKILRVR